MLSVRDEFKMIKKGYEQIYDSSIAYGMKKYLKAEQEKARMREYVDTLKKENKELKKQIEDMEIHCKELIETD